jgi:excisionase family DNA binding protein
VTADEVLRLSVAAELLGVHPDTLRRWADAGRLRVYRTPTGERRFRRADVKALLREVSA